MVPQTASHMHSHLRRPGGLRAAAGDAVIDPGAQCALKLGEWTGRQAGGCFPGNLSVGGQGSESKSEVDSSLGLEDSVTSSPSSAPALCSHSRRNKVAVSYTHARTHTPLPRISSEMCRMHKIANAVRPQVGQTQRQPFPSH